MDHRQVRLFLNSSLSGYRISITIFTHQGHSSCPGISSYLQLLPFLPVWVVVPFLRHKQQIKTIESYSPKVLWEVRNSVLAKVVSFQRALRESLFHAIFLTSTVASNPWCSLVYRLITPFLHLSSRSVLIWVFVSSPLLKKKNMSHTRWKAHLLQYDFIFINYICNGLISK